MKKTAGKLDPTHWAVRALMAAELERAMCEKIVRDEMARGTPSTGLGNVLDAIVARTVRLPMGEKA